VRIILKWFFTKFREKGGFVFFNRGGEIKIDGPVLTYPRRATSLALYVTHQGAFISALVDHVNGLTSQAGSFVHFATS
jgi:hypothetical protein